MGIKPPGWDDMDETLKMMVVLDAIEQNEAEQAARRQQEDQDRKTWNNNKW